MVAGSVPWVHASGSSPTAARDRIGSFHPSGITPVFRACRTSVEIASPHMLQNLSFEDGSMDGYTIAFGIRNVTHIEKALSEAYRWVI
jgi:hypothetical protein